MRGGLALAVILLSLPSLAAAPAAAGEPECDYVQRGDVPLGVSYLRVERHRCTESDLGGRLRYTERSERVDAHVYDPWQPDDVAHTATLHARSSRGEYPDGSLRQAHVAYARVDGHSVEARYDDEYDPFGRPTCAVTVHYANERWNATAKPPGLPACWPRGLLLP